MKKSAFILFSAAIMLASCQKNMHDTDAATSDLQETLQTTGQINEFIRQQLYSNDKFTWDMASDATLWSAVIQSGDHIVSIGYKPFDEQDVEQHLNKINIKEARWLAAKEKILQLIFEQEKRSRPGLTREKLEVWKENVLPVIDVTIENLATLKLLRKSNLIRYVEPMSYEPGRFEEKTGDSGGSGCGGYTGDNSLQEGIDYTTVTPNAKVSWNYGYHGIQNAWTKSTGAGIKLMVIDTGVSPDQANLGSEFNQGASSGRTIEKIFTIPGATNANDNCGHGTTMSGEAAAPRCTDGNACGVAYNCNFVICRAVNDVYIDEAKEVKGVSDAFIWGADNPDVKIISTSTGRITGSSQIADAVRYANSKEKLIFCAGGTSFSFTTFVGVIFPAWMPEVNAVTGIKDKENLVICNDCHKGKQIDFVIVMEKARVGKHPISTATNNTDQPTTVGGSSVATATAAGIAALVWSRFPTLTRDQVLDKLITTASAYPNKTNQYGWGKLNADAATN